MLRHRPWRRRRRRRRWRRRWRWRPRCSSRVVTLAGRTVAQAGLAVTLVQGHPGCRSRRQLSRFCVDAPLARRRGDVRAPETDFCVCSGGTTPAARETLLPPPPSVPPPSVPPPSSAPTAIEAARLFDRASCCCCLLNAVTRLALLATALLASAVALLASLVRFSSAKSLFLRFFSSFEPLRRIVGHTRCICNPDRRRTTPKENKPNEPNDEPNDVHHRIPVA